MNDRFASVDITPSTLERVKREGKILQVIAMDKEERSGDASVPIIEGDSIKPTEYQDGSRISSDKMDNVEEKITSATNGNQLAPTSEKANHPVEQKDYSSFTAWEKRFIVLTATMGAFFSPFTGQIYFPALNTIAKDLNVTASKVNLTVTTYMVRLALHLSFTSH
jgi:hypothetical protein